MNKTDELFKNDKGLIKTLGISLTASQINAVKGLRVRMAKNEYDMVSPYRHIIKLNNSPTINCIEEVIKSAQLLICLLRENEKIIVLIQKYGITATQKIIKLWLN